MRWSARTEALGWRPGEILVLGSEPASAPAYRRLAQGSAGLAGLVVEDIATARLLAADASLRSSPALVFGDVRHPRIHRYGRLAQQVENLLPAARTAAKTLPIAAPNRSTAAALWSGGLGASVRLLPAVPASANPPTVEARGCNLAVFGATVAWRARLASQALVAALSNRPAGTLARVHVDAAIGDPTPSGWEQIRSLEVGDPVHWAVFLDGGCFADLLERLHHLRAGGARIFTSGMGAYADEAQDGRVDVRPAMIFDSLRTVAAVLMEAL